MLSDYIHAAMQRVHYELLDPDEGFVATIPDLQGVIGTGDTLEACRTDVQYALEGWIVLGLKLGHPIPVLDGIDLNAVAAPLPEAA